MKEKLNLIAEKARRDKRLKFTSLIHHINEENLAECYQVLKRDKACGIDGITVEDYGLKLKENISDLTCRLKTKRYRPQPVKRIYIPKPGKADEKRGLGLPTVEDKLVQLMVKKLLEAIYEADFLDNSYGFRPNRNCLQAINRLDKEVMTKPINFIVEVDIRKFFDTLSHFWMQRCLEERVADPNLLWLVRQILKAGISEDGQYHASEQGAMQGGNLSPILANIYLHYVLDLWFEKKFKPQSKGYMQLIRYCDDLVVCCESERDAQEFLKQLEGRLKQFGLSLSADKTKIIKFGKRAWQQWQRGGNKPQTFNFLGFTHYCAKSRRGHFIMGHKTSKENLRRKLQEIKEWVKKMRNYVCLKAWWPALKAKLIGHYSYFGISGNYRCLKQFHRGVIRTVFKWINRRSQRKSMTWEIYQQYLQWNPLPTPRIYHSLYTLTPKRGMLR
jgi:group II intron reverse transcriptase/maturase